MTMTDRLSRRAMMGLMLGGAVAPRYAYAQQKGGKSMEIEIAFGDHRFTASLLDNPSARDLLTMLPLSGKIEDYSNNEKIVYLPRKLTQEGSGRFDNEAIGDLCYYAPWGNLVFYYGRYRYASGLIRLGKLVGGVQPLLTRGEFPVTIKPKA
ncbi:cyclophilin-like fold protein [Agrobacterium pusense]|uniref:cyclophilin-like fold protein n=1 Tax=Agrobacterium pusense TaxID=648995 RepID=UPI003FD2596E